jgi:peptidylprolyl isomerase
MGTTKRERQKAARAQKVEQMKKAQQRKQLSRKVIISVIVVALLAGSAILLFSKSSPQVATIPTTTTSSTTTTTTSSSLTAIANPLPAGTSGVAPTVTVPTTPPPTVEESADLIKGTGATLKVGDTFTAQYVLADYASHKVLQSSWSSGPFTAQLVSGQLIQGWINGMPGMRVGGRRELIIPPSLAYGSASQNGIPGNDTLVFVVDLLKIKA